MSRLLTNLGFKTLTAEEENYLDELAAETIFNRAVTRIAAQYDKKHAGTIASLFTDGSEAEIDRFLADNQIGWETIIGEEIAEYQEEMEAARAILTDEDA